ncbi:unnamed protein product [Auanema sp. JU1783]|nr:unnamed protein product [Auanema sp. JU1783]
MFEVHSGDDTQSSSPKKETVYKQEEQSSNIKLEESSSEKQADSSATKVENFNLPVQAIEVKIEVDRNSCGVCRRSATGEAEKLSPHGQVYKYEDDPFWISCDGCLQWFHGSCVGVEELEDFLIEFYHCSGCEHALGPTILKKCIAPHRLNCFESNEVLLPTEVGSKTWIEKFAINEMNIPMADESGCYICENGQEFNAIFDTLKTWEKVFLIKKKDDLCLKMPDNDFYIDSLLDIFGGDYVVDTIDVYKQATVAMKLSSFVSRFKSQERERLYNFLSLEFSRSEKMRDLVAPPITVNKISFVHRLWPDCHDPVNWNPSLEKAVKIAEEQKLSKPDVALFCLCGMAGSYTDFHIDFGGSSVWYHIFKGKKIFYIAPPTEENLEIYENYQKREDRTLVFLGDLFPAGQLGRVVIEEGETLMIPAGWIHAVFTPVDSLVFGGNFLHALNIDMQLRVYDLEQRVKAAVGLDDKFMFPYFELVHWNAVKSILLEVLKDSNEDRVALDASVIDGFENLLLHLKEWAAIDKKEGRYVKPYSLILKRLARQIAIQKKLRKRESSEEAELMKMPLKIKIRMGSRSESIEVLNKEEISEPELKCTNTGSLKLTIARTVEEGVAEIAETAGVIDNIDMTQMFTSKSSRGRVRKPSKWLATSVGDHFATEDNDKISVDNGIDFEWGDDMEEIVQKEERELMADVKKKHKLKPKKAPLSPILTEAPCPKKKKLATTAKQRLANRMNLK